MTAFWINSNRLNYFIILLIFIVVVSSCEEVLTLKVPEHPPMITVNSILDAGQPIRVYVTSSKPYPPLIDSSLRIKDANVKLYKDGVYIEDLFYHKWQQYYHSWVGNYQSAGNFTPEVNHSYSINVTAPGFSEVYSETKIPQPVHLISVDTVTVITQYAGHYTSALECKIKFKDPGGIKNYYNLSITRTIKTQDCDFRGINCQTKIGIGRVPYICHDLNVIFFIPNFDIPGFISLEKEEDSGYLPDEVFLTDDTFDGKTYELIVLIPLNVLGLAILGDYKGTYISRLYLNLYTINDEYFRYSSSYFKQVSKKADMFSEPCQVYSNINNGAGIFSGTSVSVDSSILMRVNEPVIMFKK